MLTIYAAMLKGQSAYLSSDDDSFTYAAVLLLAQIVLLFEVFGRALAQGAVSRWDRR
jgi:hypothetical protein